jgi:hypothetical protein
MLFYQKGERMKKLILTSIMISLLLVLMACSDIVETITETITETIIETTVEQTDYTTLINQLATEIDHELPSVINRSFVLPNRVDYIITYQFLDQIFTDEFLYESPFYDREEIITYHIKRGNIELSFNKTIQLLSLDSGHNENKIYLTIPINLNNLTREEYVDLSVRVESKINGVNVIEHETSEAKLRGRGNSTWDLTEKKPYRMRFESNTSILGMPKAKNYVLLAEFSDKSLMRNVIVQKMVSLMNNLPYSLETRFVDLYVNEEYRGVYVLTEQVEVHKNKFFIESIPGTVDTGYFLEMDHRIVYKGVQENFDWFYVRGIPYEIKEPDVDDINYSINHVNYIFEYMIAIENALIAKSNYEHLIDVDNWIEHFIIHEYVKNVDVGWSSIFMYKEQGSVMRFGPLWDFDLAIGNADYINYGYQPEGFHGMRNKNRLFDLMMDVPQIRQQFTIAYSNFYLDVVPQILEMIPVLASSLEFLAEKNFSKWDILDIYVWPNPPQVVNSNTHQAQVDYVYDYLDVRALWMYNAVWSEEYAEGNFDD